MKKRFYVTTLDPDSGNYTPQKGVKAGPYSQFGLRRALRKLETAYTVRPRKSANYILVEAK